MGSTSEFEKKVAENIRLFIHDDSKDWFAWYAIDKALQSDLDKSRECITKIASQDSFTKEEADYVYHAKKRLSLLQTIIEWFNRQPAGFAIDGKLPLLDKQNRAERAAQIGKELDLASLPHIQNALKGYTIESVLKFVDKESKAAGLDEKIRNSWAVHLLIKFCGLKQLEAVEALQKEWNTLLGRKEKSSKIQFAKERKKYLHLFPRSTP